MLLLRAQSEPYAAPYPGATLPSHEALRVLADDLRREGVQGKYSVRAPVYASAGEIPCARAAAGMLTCMSCCSSANQVVAPSEAKSRPKMATRLLNGNEPSITDSSMVSASKVKLLIFETNPDHMGVRDRALSL